jgi:hypothetical protein
MKKFSNISKSEIGKEPKLVEPTKKETELNEFKFEVMKLMNDLLSIRSYGVARPEIMIPTKIVGKEMFVEALADLLTNKSNKDQVTALESLKSTNKDWKSIEEKIDSMKKNHIDIKEAKKIADILEKYGSDEDNLKFFLEGHVKKLSSQECKEKYELVEEMFNRTKNSLLKVMSESYSNRI